MNKYKKYKSNFFKLFLLHSILLGGIFIGTQNTWWVTCAWPDSSSLDSDDVCRYHNHYASTYTIPITHWGDSGVGAEVITECASWEWAVSMTWENLTCQRWDDTIPTVWSIKIVWTRKNSSWFSSESRPVQEAEDYVNLSMSRVEIRTISDPAVNPPNWSSASWLKDYSITCNSTQPWRYANTSASVNHAFNFNSDVWCNTSQWQKKVYVYIRDIADNISLVYSDTIEYDITPPTFHATENYLIEAASSYAFTIESASDPYSWLKDYTFMWDELWERNASRSQWSNAFTFSAWAIQISNVNALSNSAWSRNYRNGNIHVAVEDVAWNVQDRTYTFKLIAADTDHGQTTISLTPSATRKNGFPVADRIENWKYEIIMKDVFWNLIRPVTNTRYTNLIGSFENNIGFINSAKWAIHYNWDEWQSVGFDDVIWDSYSSTNYWVDSEKQDGYYDLTVKSLAPTYVDASSYKSTPEWYTIDIGSLRALNTDSCPPGHECGAPNSNFDGGADIELNNKTVNWQSVWGHRLWFWPTLEIALASDWTSMSNTQNNPVNLTFTNNSINNDFELDSFWFKFNFENSGIDALPLDFFEIYKLWLSDFWITGDSHPLWDGYWYINPTKWGTYHVGEGGYVDSDSGKPSRVEYLIEPNPPVHIPQNGNVSRTLQVWGNHNNLGWGNYFFSTYIPQDEDSPCASSNYIDDSGCADKYTSYNTYNLFAVDTYLWYHHVSDPAYSADPEVTTAFSEPEANLTSENITIDIAWIIWKWSTTNDINDWLWSATDWDADTDFVTLDVNEASKSAWVDVSSISTKFDFATNIKRNVSKLTKNLDPIVTWWGDYVISSPLPTKILYLDYTWVECSEIWSSSTDSETGNKWCIVELQGNNTITLDKEYKLFGIDWIHTIIVKWANVYISSDMYYENEQNSLLGVVVLRDKTNRRNGWNLLVSQDVTNIVWSYYIEWSVLSWRQSPRKVYHMNNVDPWELTRQLLWHGSLFTANTVWSSFDITISAADWFECPYGSDTYETSQKVWCSMVDASKYDLARLRRFAFQPVNISSAECPGATEATRSPKKTWTLIERFAFAWKRECNANSPQHPSVASKLKANDPAAGKNWPIAIEYNPMIQILKLPAFSE